MQLSHYFPQQELQGDFPTNSRKLHLFLNSEQQFTDWIKNRINQYNFVENQDYIVEIVYTKGRPRKEYKLTLDMAKELCMVENNERGKEARRYFIECEKNLKQIGEAYNHRHQIPQTYSDALLLAANQAKEIEQQRKTIELQAPRIAFADKLQKSEGTLSIRDFAKLLCDKGLPLGEKRLFENLRALGLLDRTNKPYQYYVDMGVLTLKEGLYQNQTTGDAIAYTQVRVTAKGQEYIYNKLTGDTK